MISADPGALPGLDAAAVTRWLAAAGVGEAPYEFTLVSGGRSNLTFQALDATGGQWVLRRPPLGTLTAGAHDMRREWDWISRLHDTVVPVPRPVAFCADEGVTGAPFYVMGFVDGVVLDSPDAVAAIAADARGHAGEQVVDVLAELHALDADVLGLPERADRPGYVQRQLRLWQRQLSQHDDPDAAALLRAHDALASAVPPERRAVVHGDFRPGNMAFSPDGDVLAVFDWELATTGPALADLGWLLSTWREPGEPFSPLYPPPSLVPGFPCRAALAERYAARTGADLTCLDYYVAFAIWRLACIQLGVTARYRAGVMADDGYRERLALLDASGFSETARAVEAVADLGLR